MQMGWSMTELLQRAITEMSKLPEEQRDKLATWILEELASIKEDMPDPFLFNRFGGQQALIVFLQSLERTQPPLEAITYLDLNRAREIMTEYRDAQFDLVDCCIMALSERLHIQHICTFDRRDFSIFRPKPWGYLHLLPE
jgi:hypothetical protein